MLNKHTFWLVLASGLTVLAGFSARAQEFDSSAGNVILLMVDGVRWQEVFRGDENGAPIFVNLFSDYGREGVVYGNPANGLAMTTSNKTFNSLPAYQSIMAGVPQSCYTNGCGRIGVETVQERAVRELGLERGQVATIASWDTIRNAVESNEGATFVNASTQPLDDGTFDPETQQINEAQAQDVPPWKSARYDRYTWMHAMHFLKKHHPRFMFISFDDSDEWGHKNEWQAYVASLKQYDQWVKELIATLKDMGEYGAHTTLIVTTDHGRGEGSNWKNHGFLWPSSKYVWLYARPAGGNGFVDDSGQSQSKFLSDEADGVSDAGDNPNVVYTHSDIRPTIEAALGMTPLTCDHCGQVIKGVVRGF